MPNPVASESPVSEGRLWFGVLGSPIAWFFHLVVAYTLAEVACVAGFPGFDVLGLHGGVSLILGVTLLALAVTGTAGLVAYGSNRQLDRHSEKKEAPVDRGVAEQMAQWGVHLSVLFIFIIAVETIPVFFYLQPCS